MKLFCVQPPSSGFLSEPHFCESLVWLCRHIQPQTESIQPDVLLQPGSGRMA